MLMHYAPLLMVAEVLVATQLVSAAEAVERGRLPRTDAYGDPLPAGAFVRLGNTRLHCACRILTIAFAPKGRLLASAEGRTVSLWDAGTGRFVRRWEQWADYLAFSPDAKMLASGGGHDGVMLWDGTTGVAIRPCQGDIHSSIRCLTFTQNGCALFAGGAGGEIYVWDVATGTQQAILEGHRDRCYTLAVSPDGHTLASGSGDKTVRLWDIAARKERGTLYEGKAEILSVAFSPEGRTLAVGDDSGVIRLWDMGSRRESGRFQMPGKHADCVAFAPDGKSLATAGGGGICLWNLATGKVIRRLPLSDNHGVCVAFSPDGRLLAAADGSQPVRLWDVASGAALFQGGHDGPVTTVAFTEDGKHLWSASTDSPATGGCPGDYSMRCWRIAKGEEERRLQLDAEGAVWPGSVWVAFSPGADALAAGCLGSRDGRDRVRLWDGHTRKEICRFTEDLFTGSGALSRGGRVAAYWVARGARQEGFVRLRDRSTGESRMVPQGAQADDHARLSLSADGKLLACVAERKPEVRVWDVASGKLAQRIEVPQADWVFSLVFTADGQTLMIGSSRGPTNRIGIWEQNTISIWDLATRRWRRHLNGNSEEMDVTYFIACAPDGGTVICGCKDGGVSLWDVATGGLRGVHRGHRGEVLCAAFSPDGKVLATGSSDCTVLLWDLTKTGAR